MLLRRQKMEELIPVLPFDKIIAAAVLLAVLVAGIAEVSKKFGACNAVVVGIALGSGQALSVGFWLAVGTYGWLGLYLAIVVGVASSLMAMGLWKTVQPRQPPNGQPK